MNGITFICFLNNVKKEYEKRTGEQMIQFEDWSDDVQQTFYSYMMKNDVVGFVNDVLS